MQAQAIMLDILVVAIILLFAFICYRNGFANSVVRLIGWIAALVVASVASSPAGNWIYESFLHGRILSAVEEQVRSFASAEELAANIESLLSGLPAGLAGMIQVDGVQISEWITSLSDRVAFSDLAGAIVDTAFTPVVTAILSIFAFFVMFAVFSIVVRLLASAMKLINDMPVVGRVNAVLGAGIGALQGAMFVYIIALALHLAILLSGDGLSFIREQDAKNTYLFRYFYDNSIHIETGFLLG